MPIKLQKMWHNSCTTRILKMLNIVNYIERTPRSYWNVHAIHHQSVNEKMCPKKCHLSWMDDKNSEKSCKYFFFLSSIEEKIRAKVGVNSWVGYLEATLAALSSEDMRGRKRKCRKRKSFLFDNRKLGIALVLF